MATRRSASVRIGSRLVAAAVALAVAGDAARGQSFHLVGLLPNGGASTVTSLSADGRMAGGTATRVPGQHGFIWTAGQGRNDFGLEPGVPSITLVQGLSGDGTTAVGFRGDGGFGSRAFRYRGPGTYQELPALSAVRPDSEATGVSGDGSIVVGSAFPSGPPSSNRMAVRWSAAGPQGLGFLPNGFSSEATAISRDGSTIVGLSDQTNGSRLAFAWRAGTGFTILPSGTDGTAFGVNHDGRIVVGFVDGNLGGVMWRDAVATPLLLSPGLVTATPRAVSDDGGVAVGVARPAVGPSQLGGVWTPALGWELATDYLTRHGVVVPQGLILGNVAAVSADGRTLAGLAYTSDFTITQGYVATIPASGGLGALVGIGMLAFRRQRPQRR